MRTTNLMMMTTTMMARSWLSTWHSRDPHLARFSSDPSEQSISPLQTWYCVQQFLPLHRRSHWKSVGVEQTRGAAGPQNYSNTGSFESVYFTFCECINE